MKWSKKSVAGAFDEPAECETFIKHLPHGDDSATIREKPDVWLRRHIRLVNERLICGGLDRDCVPNAEYSETRQLIPALRLQQIWVWVDVMKWSKKSVAGAFDDPAECETFRKGLAVLQQQLYVYARMLENG